MAFRRAISKRVTQPLNLLKNDLPQQASSRAALKTMPDFTKNGLFRRFLQQKRNINQAAPMIRLPEFLYVPSGEKLREQIKSLNVSGDRIRVDGVLPPAAPAKSPEVDGISAVDARKIMRSAQLEKIRSQLKNIPANSVSYNEYVRICGESCENPEQGLEFANKLDEAGSVIIVGNVVFLRPDQVAKSVEKMICQTIGVPNDPRRKELEEMEKEKAIIDTKARSLVKGELYCGLGFLVAQTLGFMRLTFWELTWDVMEPICFFVTSIHFALAYGFFLRTSTEPTFEGFFRRRFKTKQVKLMKIHNFDVKKYEELCRTFYPLSYGNQSLTLKIENNDSSTETEREVALSTM